jgi:hypothetical protein
VPFLSNPVADLQAENDALMLAYWK